MFMPKVKVVGVVFALFLITNGAWLLSTNSLKAQVGQANDPTIKELLQEKLSVFQEIASQMIALQQVDQVSATDVFEANQQVHNAELDLCDTSMERVAVLTKMLAEVKDHEKDVTEAVKRGSVSRFVALKTKVTRLDVEIALQRAKDNTTR